MLKFNFLLWTCPQSFIEEAIGAFDSALYESVSSIVGARLPEWLWCKATLPVSMGGLGLRLAGVHASAAFVSSFIQSRPLVSAILNRTPSSFPHLQSALSHLATVTNHSEWVSEESVDVRVCQSSLGRAVDQTQFDQFLENSPDVRSRAIALSSSVHHAGDWLNVVPCSALGLHRSNWELRLCLRYWLGLPMLSSDNPCCPVCSTTSNLMYDHLVTC